MAVHPFVSIIMPLYNKRPYVKRAIKSIQQQTFTAWELIIVDDGSTDGSIAEVPQDDSRIRLFQQENRGPAAARNHGISMASGEFISFIDADNYYYPRKLEVEYDLLQKNRAEWLLSPFEDEKGNHIELRWVKDINGNELNCQPLVFDKAFTDLQLSGLHIDGLWIKSELLEQLGGFNENMRCYEITEFIIRCALKQPRVVIYNQPLFRVIDVPGSAFKVSAHLIDGLKYMGESLYHLSINYPEYSDILSLRSQRNLLNYAASLILLDKKEEARTYLLNNFPYARNSRWWKMWFGSWLPTWLVQHLYA